MHTVRRILPTDGAAIRALRLKSLETDAPAFSVTPEILEALSAAEWDTFCVTNATNPAQAVFVAAGSDALIGMAGILRDRSPKLHHTGLVWGVYVAPTTRGRGVAAALIHALIAFGAEAGYSQLKLAVTAYAPAAARLYERCGFVPYAHEPDFLAVDGIMYDATHMRFVYPRK